MEFSPLGFVPLLKSVKSGGIYGGFYTLLQAPTAPQAQGLAVKRFFFEDMTVGHVLDMGFVPALTTCASKRMKAVGFCSFRALPLGNAKRFRQSVQPCASGEAGCAKGVSPLAQMAVRHLRESKALALCRPYPARPFGRYHAWADGCRGGATFFKVRAFARGHLARNDAAAKAAFFFGTLG